MSDNSINKIDLSLMHYVKVEHQKIGTAWWSLKV